jgi:hypothetical protein
MNPSTTEHTSRSTRAFGSTAPGGATESPPTDPSAEAAGVGDTMTQLSRDVGKLKDTFAQLMSQIGDRGVKAAQGVGQSVASQVGTAASGIADTSSDLVATASGHAKTITSELEGMARRNPLATILGALLVGAVFGMMSSRGRG